MKNPAAACMAAVDAAVDEFPAPVSEEHREVQWALSLFRSGQYLVEDHAPTIRAIARRLRDHPDADVRKCAAALAEAVGDYRVNPRRDQ